MQEYNNMDIKQLAGELNKLDDDSLCLIVKSLETEKMRELIPLLNIDRGLRLVQELTLRKGTNEVSNVDNIPVQLQLALTAEDIAPTPNLLLRSNLFSASRTHGQVLTPYVILILQPTVKKHKLI